MKVMTFNIQHAKNYITKQIDVPLMAKTIKELDADIVVLQEVYGDYSSGKPGQAEEIASLLGFRSYFAPAIDLSSCRYGNAIVSRYPIISAENIPVPSDNVAVPGRYFESRCIINAEVETPEGIINIIGTHFGLQPEEAELSVRRICSIARNDIPTVFMGDLNLHPESEILDPIRRTFRDTDIYYHGDNNFTFPSDRPHEKIDYIFTGGKTRVISVTIPRVIAADHLPIVAEIEI